MRALARWLLLWAERLYLKAHGWDKLASGQRGEAELYLPPNDYNYKRHDTYDRRHAVNAQHYVYSMLGKGPISYTAKMQGKRAARNRVAARGGETELKLDTMDSQGNYR